MNDASAHIGEVRILKGLIQQLAGDLLQCEAVCRYLRGEVERLKKERDDYHRQLRAADDTIWEMMEHE